MTARVAAMAASASRVDARPRAPCAGDGDDLVASEGRRADATVIAHGAQ